MSGISTSRALLDAHVRAIGHTTAAIEIAEKCKGCLVVSHQPQKNEIWMRLSRNSGVSVLTLADIEHGRMIGLRKPIIVDHHAYAVLLSETLAEVDEILKSSRKTSLELEAALNLIHGLQLKLSKKSKSRRK